MPRKLNLEDELKEAKAQFEIDPDQKSPINVNVTQGLYIRMLEHSIESGAQTISRHTLNVLKDYYSGTISIENGLNSDQRRILTALTKHWGIGADESLGALLNCLLVPGALEQFLEWDRQIKGEQTAPFRVVKGK